MMNQCQELQQQFDDYLTGRISDFVKHRIDSHLRVCTACAQEMQEYREVVDMLCQTAEKIEIEPSLNLALSLNRLVTQQSGSQDKPLDTLASLFGRLRKTNS